MHGALIVKLGHFRTNLSRHHGVLRCRSSGNRLLGSCRRGRLLGSLLSKKRHGRYKCNDNGLLHNRVCFFSVKSGWVFFLSDIPSLTENVKRHEKFTKIYFLCFSYLIHIYFILSYYKSSTREVLLA